MASLGVDFRMGQFQEMQSQRGRLNHLKSTISVAVILKLTIESELTAHHRAETREWLK